MAKMTGTNRQKLNRLLNTERADDQPRISIYMTTHRRPPDNQADPIVLKNLIQKAEQELTKRYSLRQYEAALNSLYALQEDTAFWLYTQDGLAVFATGNELEAFDLQYSPGELVTVENRFHILTLLGYLESLDEAILAEIGKDRVGLFRVNRYDHEPLETDMVETSFYQLFDDLDAQGHLNQQSVGGRGSVQHGYRTTSQEVEKDRDKYFRYLSDSFTSLHRETKLPVILAGTAPTLAEFRKIAKGDFYLDTQIEKPLDSFEPNDLQKQIAAAMSPIYGAAQDQLRSRIRRAEQDGRLADVTDEIEKAAQEGRIEELVVNLTRLQPGDITLDQVIQKSVKTSTTITVLQEGLLDWESPYAAILRY